MNAGADNTGPHTTQTIDAKGKAPERRMATVTAAWATYQRIRQANLRRDQRFGDIAGIHAGFPPRPPAQNERNGQADMPNLNTKQFSAKVGTYVSTWTALNAQTDGMADIRLRHENPMEAERRSKMVTKHFNAAIRQWDATDEEDFESGSEYLLESAARDTQMGLYGIGCAFFADKFDFRFQTVPTRRILIPDGTRLTLKNCPAIFIEDTISVPDLYAMRKKPGWNEGAILSNLYDHVEMRTPDSARQYSYAEWVNQIRDNDTWLLTELSPVRLIHVYVKEFDGQITHTIMTDLYGKASFANQSDSEFKKESGSFLFEMTKSAKRWRQVLIPFADNAGPECDWHGVKGFGDLIFDGCHENNQMYNKALTGAMMANLMMFQGMGENDAQKLDQVVFTQFGIMPCGLSIEPVRFQPDVEAAMLCFNSGSQIMSENTRISPQFEKTVSNDPVTATEVNANRADRAALTTLQVLVYRAVGQDVLFGEMYRRITNPDYPKDWGGGIVAKRFREACEHDGIPVKELREVEYVRANRNGGSGDMMLDLMKAKELIAVATPGEGQLNARYEAACALKGPEMAEAFVQREQDTPGQAEAMLAMENNLIQVGQIPQAFGWQLPEVHIPSHLQLLAEAAKAASMLMEKGIEPAEVEPATKLNNLLVAGIQHVAQHIALIGEIPKVDKKPPLYEPLQKSAEKQVHNLQQLSDALTEDIQKAQAESQPQANIPPEQAKAALDMQIKAAAAEQKAAIDESKAKQKLGNQAVAVQAKTEMAMQTHQVKLALAADADRQELEHRKEMDALELEKQRATAEQDIAAQAAQSAIAVNTADAKAKAAEKAAKAKPKTPKK